MKTIAKNTFLMIDVSSLAPLSRTPDYNPDLVEQLAVSIVEAGGLITPLIVRQIGLMSYKLADEYAQSLEYLAVVRAKEIDPRLCEMVNCFVVSDDCTPPALNQLDIIKNIARYAR